MNQTQLVTNVPIRKWMEREGLRRKVLGINPLPISIVSDTF